MSASKTAKRKNRQQARKKAERDARKVERESIGARQRAALEESYNEAHGNDDNHGEPEPKTRHRKTNRGKLVSDTVRQAQESQNSSMSVRACPSPHKKHESTTPSWLRVTAIIAIMGMVATGGVASIIAFL